MNRETWYGCYDDGWGDLIVSDAYSHPAKFARGLIYRLIQEGIRRGWWAPGVTHLIDPFAGVALGGLVAAAHGLAWTGVELEQKFVDLGRQNIDLHRADWECMGYPIPRILLGDSRRLAEILAGVGISGGVTSPPYSKSLNSLQHSIKDSRRSKNPKDIQQAYYGTTPGQLGAMPEGAPPMGAVTSPPYADSVNSGQGGIDWQKAGRPERSAPAGSRHGVQGASEHEMRYGTTEGQIGAMGGITSPPFSRPASPDTTTLSGPIREIEKKPGQNYRTNDLVADNIARTEGETYWSACEVVYRQLYALFSPGSHLAVVVKPFVRNKKLVDLPQMTLDLLLHIGFEPVTWIDAMLVSEGEQQSAWPDEVPHKRKKRASFFRLLAERKGAPRIDAEVVLVVRRPTPL